jgi:O-antigen ligase
MTLRWPANVMAGSAWPAVAAVGLLAVAVIGARVASIIFFAAGVLMLVPVGYLAWRRPRPMLVLLVLAPLLDRFVVSLVIPAALRSATSYASEALLIVVGAAVALRATRSGHLLPAVRHPVMAAVGLFTVLGGLAAALNGVPLAVASAGLIFTLDATALFVLPRLTPFTGRQAEWAANAFVGVAGLAAVLAMGQVLIHPNFLGLESFAGRFSEGARVTSLLISPNLLGVLLAMAMPFPLLAVLHSTGRSRWSAGGVALLLSLALLYTFSRGAWLALLVAIALIAIVVDWRAIAALVLLGALTFAIGLVLPRHLLDPARDSEHFDLIAATLGRLEALGEGDLRVQFVENAIPIVEDHPLLGTGPGRYGGSVARAFGSPLYDQYTAGTVPRGRTVDNFWLHLLVESGVTGTLAFAMAVAAAVWSALRTARRTVGSRRAIAAACAAVGVILAVDSLTEMVLEGNTTSFAAWFLLGLASSLVVTAEWPVPGRREVSGRSLCRMVRSRRGGPSR